MASAAQFLSGVQGGWGATTSSFHNDTMINFVVPWDCHQDKSIAAASFGAAATIDGPITDITGAVRVDHVGYIGTATSHAKGCYVTPGTPLGSYNVTPVTTSATKGCVVRYIDKDSVAYSAFLGTIAEAETIAAYAGDVNAAQLLGAFYGLIKQAIEGIKPGSNAYPAMIFPAFTDHRLGLGV